MGRWEIQAADRGDGKAEQAKPDPPLDGLAVIVNHGMGVVYDLNEIHGARIVEWSYPSAYHWQRERAGKRDGRPLPVRLPQHPLEQWISVIPVDVIPGNIRGYGFLAESRGPQ